MEDLGVARGYIDLDLGKMNQSIATAVSQLQKIDQQSKKTDSEIAVLQSTSTKTGNAFQESAKQAQSLASKLEAAKSKVEVYEKEMGVLKTQIEAGKKAQVDLARTIEDTKKKYESAKDAVADLDKKYRESKESLAAIKETHKQNNQALQTAKKAMSDYNSQIKAVNKTSKDYATQIAKLEKEQAGVVKEQEKTNRQIQTAKEHYSTAKKSVTDFEKALEDAKDTMHATASEYGYNSEETKKAQKAVADYEVKLEDAKKALSKYADELDTLKKTQEDSNKTYNDLGKAIDTAKTKYKEAEEAASKLADAQKETTDELEKAQTAYDKSAKAVQDAKDETKGYKAELEDAKRTAQDYGNEVNNLENKQRQLDAEMDNAGDKLNDFETDCNNAKADVNQLSIELANVKSNAQQFGQFMEDAGNKLKNVGSKMQSFGRNLTTHVTTPLTAAATAAVKMAGDVETSLAKVETIADTSQVSIKEISEGVREISDATGTAQKDLNEGVYQWISATADTESALQGVAAANKLAIGGFTDNASAVDLLTTVLNTYGMELTEVDRLSDELLATQNYGKTTVGELAGSLGQLVPTAHAAGVSFEELLADMAILTRNGLATDQATTALRGALNSMIDPSSDAANAAAALGIQWDSAALQSKGFAGMMKELSDALANTEPKYKELSEEMDRINGSIQANNETIETNKTEIESLETANEGLKDQMRAVEDSAGKSSQAWKNLKRQYEDNTTAISRLKSENKELDTTTKKMQKSADGLAEQMELLSSAAESPISVFAELFGNVRGLTAALSLGDNLDEFNVAMDEVTNSTGKANKAFETMQKTNAAKLQKSINRLKNTAIDAGEKIAPVVADIVDKVADIITKFSELDESEQKQILTIGAVVAAAGPAISIAGKVVGGIGSVVGGIGSLIRSASTVTTVAGTAVEAVEGMAGAAGTASTALGTKGLSGVLGALATPGVGYAVAAAAAITAIGVACVYAHDKAIENNLAEHFGNIKLSAEEVESVVKRLTATPWKAQLEVYSTAKKDLEQIEEDIQETVDRMNLTQWKVKTGIELTEEEKDSYTEDVTAFLNQTQSWVSQNKLATQIAISTIFGDDNQEGKDITSLTDSIYNDFETELSTLGEELASLVNTAFEDNLLDESEMQAITDKRKEIQKLLNDWTEAEYDIKLRGFDIDITGGDITPDSYKKITEEIRKQYEDASEEIESAAQQIMVPIQYEYNTSNKTAEDKEKLEKGLKETILNATGRRGELVLKGINYEIETIEGHYDKATRETATHFMDDMTDTFNSELKRAMSGEISFDTFMGYIDGQLSGGFEDLSWKEQDAVRRLLNMMQPEEAELQRIANEYRAAGEAVPESISEGLTNIELMRALVGDVDSGYALLADRVADSPELTRAIMEYTHAGGLLPVGLMDALRSQYPDIYDAAIGVDEELAQGIINGTSTVTGATNDVVDSVDRTVKNRGPVNIDVGVKQASNTGSVLQWIIDQIRNALSRIKINLPISFSGKLSGYSSGGIVRQAQVATIAEGNEPEAIIPLSMNQRSNALRLYEQVGDMIGAENALKPQYSKYDADLADRIASKLELVFRNAPIQTTIDMMMEDGDVIMDSETVGRKVAPTVSRVQAKRL